MLRLNEFDIVMPETVADAVATLEGNPGAMVVAGGTDLVPKLKRGQFEPATLVSISGLRDLDYVETDGDCVSIGAMTTLKTIERSGSGTGPGGLSPFASVGRAASQVATPIIRNSATLGGNLLQDTRCRYYDRSHLWREAIGYCDVLLRPGARAGCARRRSHAVGSGDANGPAGEHLPG
jgi:4-hydroxybenzoyl-CoA reductase subunit beta